MSALSTEMQLTDPSLIVGILIFVLFFILLVLASFPRAARLGDGLVALTIWWTSVNQGHHLPLCATLHVAFRPPCAPVVPATSRGVLALLGNGSSLLAVLVTLGLEPVSSCPNVRRRVTGVPRALLVTAGLFARPGHFLRRLTCAAASLEEKPALLGVGSVVTFSPGFLLVPAFFSGPVPSSHTSGDAVQDVLI